MKRNWYSMNPRLNLAICQFGILVFFLILSGFISTFYGKDLSWDFANYHYYNPYSFLWHRTDFDYWPVSFIHIYFNPAADFFTYYLINHFSPWHSVFISGAIHGINGWLIFLIANRFLQSKNKPATGIDRDHFPAFIFAMILSILGLYSAMIFPSIGDFKNDNIVCIFVLYFVYLQIMIWDRFSAEKIFSYRFFILSAVVLGIGAGIKLTAAVFVIGSLMTVLILPIHLRDRCNYFFLLACFSFIGILISSGYWMLILWGKFHNPLFPFFNNIFHSPNFPPINFHYSQYTPANLWQALLYIFTLSWHGSGISDEIFRDFRFAIIALLFISFGLVRGGQKLSGHKNQKITLPEYWLFGFMISSFIAWEFYFSIIRYITPIALLTPLCIFLLAKKLISNLLFRSVFLFCIYTVMIVCMVLPISVRMPRYETSFFNVKLPYGIDRIKNATVLIAYPEYALNNVPKPQTYLIPFFPHNWRFLGIPFTNEHRAALHSIDKKKILERVSFYDKPFYLLTSGESMHELKQVAASLGLMQIGDCKNIYSDRQMASRSETLLCPAIKRR